MQTTTSRTRRKQPRISTAQRKESERQWEALEAIRGLWKGRDVGDALEYQKRIRSKEAWGI